MITASNSVPLSASAKEQRISLVSCCLVTRRDEELMELRPAKIIPGDHEAKTNDEVEENA